MWKISGKFHFARVSEVRHIYIGLWYSLRDKFQFWNWPQGNLDSYHIPGQCMTFFLCKTIFVTNTMELLLFHRSGHYAIPPQTQTHHSSTLPHNMSASMMSTLQFTQPNTSTLPHKSKGIDLYHYQWPSHLLYFLSNRTETRINFH